MAKINFYILGNDAASAVGAVDKVRLSIAEKLVAAFDDKEEFKDEISAARAEFMCGYVATRCNVAKVKAKEILTAGKGDKALDKAAVNTAMSQWAQISKIAWPEASRRGGGRKAASTKAEPVKSMTADEFLEAAAQGDAELLAAYKWAFENPAELLAAHKAATKTKTATKTAPRRKAA